MAREALAMLSARNIESLPMYAEGGFIAEPHLADRALDSVSIDRCRDLTSRRVKGDVFEMWKHLRVKQRLAELEAGCHCWLHCLLNSAFDSVCYDMLRSR